MTPIRSILIAGVLAFSPFGLASTAQAVSPNFPSAALTKINHDGFYKCKSMGPSGYTAIARGIVGDGGGYRSASSRNFHLRTCFATLSQCSYFIERIDHYVSQIDELRYAACKPRS